MTIEPREAVVPGCRDAGEYATRHGKAPAVIAVCGALAGLRPVDEVI
jgi:hypothetical protein